MEFTSNLVHGNPSIKIFGFSIKNKIIIFISLTLFLITFLRVLESILDLIKDNFSRNSGPYDGSSGAFLVTTSITSFGVYSFSFSGSSTFSTWMGASEPELEIHLKLPL